MKKNLNIAYLNGAEGIRRCSASSGGSSGGECIKREYYNYYGGLSKVSQLPPYIAPMLEYADRVVIMYGNEPYITVGGEATRMWLQKEINDEDIVKIAYSKENPCIYDNSIKEFLKELLESEWDDELQIKDELDRLTPITKEEFYNLDNIESPVG